MAGQHSGGSWRTGGSLPCGLWLVHKRKEVMSLEHIVSFNTSTLLGCNTAILIMYISKVVCC